MCLHPKLSIDLIDQPLVYNSSCTFSENCNYLSVDNQIKIENEDIVILQLNIRGLFGKIKDLKKLVNNSFKGKLLDVLLLCETWMSVNSPDVKLPGYNKFECRRTHKQGGGVCIFVNDMLNSKSKLDLHMSDVHFEHCLVEIELKKYKLILGSLYRAPNTDQSIFLNEYKNFIETIKKIPNSEIILGMDHNLDLLKSHVHKKTQQFLNLNLDHDLFPVITRPTRITHTSATLIDNIFLDSRLTGRTINKILVDDISDHLPSVVILENMNPSKHSKIEITSRDIRPKQIGSLKNELTSVLKSTKLNGDTNDQFDEFHKILSNGIDAHCPIKTHFVKRDKFRKEPWLTSGLLISCNKQKKLYQNSISGNPKPQIVEKYKTYQNTLKKLKRISKINYYKDKCTEYKNNVRKLWHMINSCIGKTSDKTTIIDHIHVDNIDIFDSKRISNEFGKYFSTIGNQYSNKIRPPNKSINSYLNVIPKNTKSIFLAPTTSEEIVVIHCDFEQIKKTVELQSIQSEIEQSHSDKMPSEESDKVISTNSPNKSSTSIETDQTEAHTSIRKRTVIDYKKFLEDYADEPPSPPKKKREVDLKRRPSKSRIAAEKYSRSKYFTKLTHLPRPVRRGTGKRHIAPALCSNEPQLEPTNQTPKMETTTTTVPATLQETQEAIALLLLGNPPEQELPEGEDNTVLMPIVGPNGTNLEPVPLVPPDMNPVNPVKTVPKPGTLLGIVIKTDQSNNPAPMEDQPDEVKEHNDDQTDDTDTKKKTFITKEYGLKRRAKTKGKFKCSVCAMELETV